jgi:hypothetical protein
VLRPSSEFVRELLRPADEEDRWRNPFIIVTRPEINPATIAPSQFNPLHGLFECPIAPQFGQNISRENSSVRVS